MSAESNRDIARRFVEQAWGRGNLEAARELLSPDLINHRTRPGEPQGLEGFLSTLRLYRDAFPVRRFIVERLVTNGDEVSDSWEMIAFHEGEFFGFPPTGKILTLSGADWYHIEGGKIVEVWHEQDVFGVIMELSGVLP